MGLKELALRVWIGRKAKEVSMGKLGAGPKAIWEFLDGWKSWIVAVVLSVRMLCENCVGMGYVDSVLKGLGWDPSMAAFDPAQFAGAVGVLVALGHRLMKAITQYRSGVPIPKLLSEK